MPVALREFLINLSIRDADEIHAYLDGNPNAIQEMIEAAIGDDDDSD